ncbi:TVP38/TMEM64 family protein [Hymenobacter lutimineralis]|uniref:TVP38/TMEM64 family membrane protein n=1 Tax=Hymenobacter lutimineralis TaxID=2606448 RepID=A0A5D6V9F5_9BACT|nr:TVP38/TMEM64 family protein [Hymenobacter lutimineralis]TYZ11865.1 TVP38/TMEM64 family protein [Hymenobacter lutimineralis]
MATTESAPISPHEQASSSRLPLYVSLGIVAALVGCYFLWPAFHDGVLEAFRTLTSGDKPRIAAWVKQFGFWGPVLVVVAMVAQMFLVVINNVLLILVAILAYGPWWGSLLAWVAVLTASSVGYFLGRMLGGAFVAKILGRKNEQKVEEQVGRYGIGAVFIARLTPVISNDAISFVAGLGRLGYLKFISATAVGILPLIGLLAYLGEDTGRLKSGLLWVSGISLLLFGAYVFWDKRRHPATAQKPADGRPKDAGPLPQHTPLRK